MNREVKRRLEELEDAWSNVESLIQTSDYYKPLEDDDDVELIRDLYRKELKRILEEYSQ